ncbi:class I SAM-dependent methyltransferase [Nocardia stercoris]|uniref:S-adenosyl-L-methionine-dependent methyltransferase n=1 Tax=Nocardia stercoris TaxID=2483361 RepID=A0A3M2L8P0_9NOCA|nr:class I SAM-dependent methyltransferase [Nocardia stercoris]RMI33406.1 SAM-dependent methyltransferase [Nocardia stercoris]
MDSEGPSRTALVTAYARAYHQVADRPLIFTDPLAARALGVTADGLTESLGRATEPGTALDRPRRLFFAARSRFAEDRVAVTGARQVVILGAGLDTFAYRNPNPDLRVFEVDHPDTQDWKRRLVTAAGLDHPAGLTFVPVDFETDTLATRLAAAGFSRTEPAVFVWLGVVFYLTPDAAHSTLEYIAGQDAPVEVVFDYLQPADTDEDRAYLEARARRLAAIGEPFVNYFTPADIAAQLRVLGFTDIEDHPAPDLITGYLDDSTEFDEDSARTLRASRMIRAGR